MRRTADLARWLPLLGALAASGLAAGSCNAVLGVNDLVVIAPDAGGDDAPSTGSGGGDCGGACPAASCCGGVCVDLQSDSAHCSACGTDCLGAECVAGACTATCVEGFGDCNLDPGDGCETDLGTDPAHCGDCAAPCAPSSTCVGASCTCPPGFGDCDGDPANGCEADTQTDESNCGGCTQPCGTNETCVAAACTCAMGFLDCDAAAGCESDAASPSSCGTCSVMCGATEVCDQGTCAMSCSPGLELCGASCVDLSTNPLNCGACGTAVGPHQTCVGGNPTCDTDYGDCNASPGCETSTTADPANCGGCNTQCKAGAVCVQSGCVCAGATPKDCGTSCQVCCVSADCGLGQICSAGVCVSGCTNPLLATFGENTNDTHQGVTLDTELHQGKPSQNFGTSPYIRGRHPAQAEVGLFEFVLTALPPTAYVCSATLRLFNDGNDSTDTFIFQRVLEPWAEGIQNDAPGEPNWNARTAATLWINPGCGNPSSSDPAVLGSFVPVGPGGTQYDVALPTSLVQGWVDQSIPNYGVAWKCLMGTSSGANLRSSESPVDGQRPSLRINYFVP